MLKEIRITKQGEILLPYPGTHLRDDIELSLCVGVHKHCECFVDIRKVAAEINALICRRCNLRVLIPITIKTWNELAAYMKEARE